jgi:hypothetical protein
MGPHPYGPQKTAAFCTTPALAAAICNGAGMLMAEALHADAAVDSATAIAATVLLFIPLSRAYRWWCKRQ